MRLAKVIGIGALVWGSLISEANSNSAGLFSPARLASDEHTLPSKEDTPPLGSRSTSTITTAEAPGGLTLRRRYASVDFDRLTTARTAVERAAATAVTLALNLFEDTGFKGVIVRTAPTASGYSLSGHLKDVPLGTVSLVVNGGTVAGSVRTPSATYTIRSAGEGHVEIRQVDPSTLPPGAEPATPKPRYSDAFLRKSSVRDDDEAVIDVLVLWTPVAREEAGGRAAIEALIDLYVVESNQAYRDSGVQQAIHLVHMEEIDYVEHETDVGVDLSRLAEPDGHMDSVLDLRDRTGADLVNLVVASGPGLCGVAFGWTRSGDELFPGERGNFSVVRHDCHDGTFAHELGHNMGLAHDRYVDRDWEFKPYPYAHGYVNQAAFEIDAIDSQRWITIMAYQDQCNSAGFECARLLRFSNPDQTHLNDPLGVPGEVETWGLHGPADARRAMNNTRSRIAALQTTRPVLTVRASASEIELKAAESFALRAEVRNGGRVAAEPTHLSFRRSADAVITLDDTEVGAIEIDGIGATSAQIESVAVTAPSESGNYYFGACVDSEQAANGCSEAVHVTVGPTISIAPARATEGENLAFSVSLSEARTTPVTVRWEVSSESAAPVVDYAVEGERTLTIPSGETAGTILVSTVADSAAEPDDTLTVTLIDVKPSAPEGVVLSAMARHASGTIVNDDGDLAIPDATFRKALELALGKAAGNAIEAADLADLTTLDWGYEKRREIGEEAARIADLTGLEFATRLKTLIIDSNDIATLTPITHLTALASLEIGGNDFSDISPLRHLTGLRKLWSGSNRISNIAPLRSLVSLRDLGLSGNSISDLSPLAHLTELRTLSLKNNAISDLSPLDSLSKLNWILLDSNPISELQPLENLTNLLFLDLSDALVSDVSPLGGLSKLSRVSLAGNAINDISPLRGLRNACGFLNLDGNSISDLSALSEFNVLLNVSLNDNEISDLSPLTNLVGIQRLRLANNAISEIGPLAGLTQLTELNLANNAISDISALAGLTLLTELHLSGNSIADIDVLEPLIQLTKLYVSGNSISDISPLADMNQLFEVDLGHNRITDISLLASESNFSALRKIYVHANPLSEESLETHLPAIRNQRIEIFDVVLTVTDASAREGEPIVSTVRMSSMMEEPVSLSWTTLLHSDLSAFSNLGFRPTATSDDFDFPPTGTVTIPAGATEVQVEISLTNDGVDERHETAVISLFEPQESAGVTLSHRDPQFFNLRYSQAVGLIVDASGPSHDMLLFPPANHQVREGFARVVNRARRNAVHIDAFDDLGQRHGSATLSLNRGEVAHFNSSDLENGNLDKGVPRGVGSSNGDWRLKLWSNDIDVLTYMRTSDGFLTSMHDTLLKTSAGDYYAPIFNPGSNRNQVSVLRLINPSADPAEVSITGTDDMGVAPGSTVTLTIDAGAARTITAQELESGEGLDGALGDGVGKWRLTVNADRPLVVASLMESPTGHLTNLSTLPDNKAVGDEGVTTHHVPLFLSAADPRRRQGFVRVVNRGTDDATVSIEAFDDTEWDYDTVTLNVGAGEAAHFNSEDLELGNASKGLARGIGAGEGDWRLELSSEADIDVLAYIRTEDGFLTSMHDTAPLLDDGYAVPIFNPGSNRNQVSRLLVVNAGEEDATLTIQGVDDLGVTPGGDVTMTVPAGRSRSVSARLLEGGGDRLENSLGDGAGKWQLVVASDQPIQVMSLLESPTGHLTNLSTAPGVE